MNNFEPNLLNNLPKSAILKKNPEINNFDCKGLLLKNQWSIKVLNHTDFKVEFCSRGSFFIDDCQAYYQCRNNTQIIFYCLEDHPEMLCIEKKQDESKALGRFFINICECDLMLKPDSENIIHKISEMVCKKKIFIPLLLGLKDKESFFCINNIARDIIFEITLQYDRSI